jgi:hypothetical protein
MDAVLFLRIKSGETPQLNGQELFDLYDLLIKEADKILGTYNPCGIENGHCRHRLDWCCNECYRLISNRCSVKSLECKTYVCQVVRTQFRECADKLDWLYFIGRKYGFILQQNRLCKEDIFGSRRSHEHHGFAV